MLVIGQHKLMQNSIRETMHAYAFKVFKDIWYDSGTHKYDKSDNKIIEKKFNKLFDVIGDNNQ